MTGSGEKGDGLNNHCVPKTDLQVWNIASVKSSFLKYKKAKIVLVFMEFTTKHLEGYVHHLVQNL